MTDSATVAEQIFALLMPVPDGRICTYRQGRRGTEPYWMDREEFVAVVQRMLVPQVRGSTPIAIPMPHAVGLGYE